MEPVIDFLPILLLLLQRFKNPWSVPYKATTNEKGHLFPRNKPVEVCSDTDAKLSNLPNHGFGMKRGLKLESSLFTNFPPQ
jgi:hypothetical protein